MIALQNVAYRYQKKRPLIDNLDLDLKPGHIYGLLGKNGTGKTTLLKLIQGVLFNKAGDIHFNGIASRKRKADNLNQLFYLQEEYELPSIKIGDYITAYAPFYPNFDKSKFDSIVQTFELVDDRPMTKYSYGQKKKFLIAFGLASNTDYLLLDEPTCLLYTSPSPRDLSTSRMPSSA